MGESAPAGFHWLASLRDGKRAHLTPATRGGRISAGTHRQPICDRHIEHTRVLDRADRPKCHDCLARLAERRKERP